MEQFISKFTLIILHVVSGFGTFGGVGPHHVIVHDCRTPEEGETAGTTKHAAQHVLGSLLQPVTDGVLELLIPHHGS